MLHQVVQVPRLPPVLQFIFDFICIHNVHTLVSIMEMISRAYHVAASALDASLQTDELSLRGTLRHDPPLVLYVRHAEILALTELVRDRTLTPLILHHVNFGQVIVIFVNALLPIHIVVILRFRILSLRHIITNVRWRMNLKLCVLCWAAAAVQALFASIIAEHRM